MAELEVLHTIEEAPPLERVVLLGMPKGPLLEEALTLGTEAGATAFRLITARYSQPHPPRMDRLEKVLRVAATQCRRSHLPLLRGPGSLREALVDLPAERWLGAQGAAGANGIHGPAALAIGPEGGWSPEETTLLLENGFREVGLGPFVLRNPTAVAVGLGRLFPG
jgi:16S rRNA (uracil1498-N3)-methyltransferase